MPKTICNITMGIGHGFAAFRAAQDIVGDLLRAVVLHKSNDLMGHFVRDNSDMLKHKEHKIRMFRQHRKQALCLTDNHFQIGDRTDVHFPSVMLHEGTIPEDMPLFKYLKRKFPAAFRGNRNQGAAAFGMFILPEGFLAGGVTGSARLICSALDIPLFLLVLIIDLCLLALGFLIMGMKFVSKSVFSSLYFPFALGLLEHICLPLNRLPVPIVSAIAGAVLGLGAALVIKGKGSSGGYDIVAIILNSKFNLPIPVIVNGIDLTLILTQIPGSSALTLFGGLFTILMSTGMMHLTLKTNHFHILCQKSLDKDNRRSTKAFGSKGVEQ